MKRKVLSISAVMLLTAFNGCGGGQTLTPAQMQKVKEFDVTKIDVLGDAIHKGMNDDELLFYAPVSIAKAKEDYESALGAEQKDEKLAYYLAAKKDLANAYETKKLVKKYLNDVAEIDSKMQKQNTQEIFTKRYDDFKDEYNDLITTIDEGKVSDALADKKEVMLHAKDLYGDAVVYRNINQAKVILDKMEDENYDEAVPKHFEQARKLYEDSRARIKREPDHTELIKDISVKTNNAALYAQTLAKDVMKAKTLADENGFEFYFDVLHHNIASLNPEESIDPILPLSVDEKVLYLKNNLSSKKSNEEVQQKVERVEVEKVVETPIVKELNDTNTTTKNESVPGVKEAINAVDESMQAPVETAVPAAAVMTPVSLDAVKKPIENSVEEKPLNEEEQIQKEAIQEGETVVEEDSSVTQAAEEAPDVTSTQETKIEPVQSNVESQSLEKTVETVAEEKNL